MTHHANKHKVRGQREQAGGLFGRRGAEAEQVPELKGAAAWMSCQQNGGAKAAAPECRAAPDAAGREGLAYRVLPRAVVSGGSSGSTRRRRRRRAALRLLPADAGLDLLSHLTYYPQLLGGTHECCGAHC